MGGSGTKTTIGPNSLTGGGSTSTGTTVASGAVIGMLPPGFATVFSLAVVAVYFSLT